MKEYLEKDLYEILGITFEADVIKIKSAYRKKARVCHPDVNNNTPESIKEFKEITEAYEFLLDENKRKQYDEIKGFARKRAEASQAKRAQARQAYTHTAKEEKTTKEKPKTAPREDKQSFSSVFNTILDGLFPDDDSPEKKKSCKPANGRDINLNVSIKIDEAINGAHRTINVLHTEMCPKCEGRKFINGAKCPMCKGTGELSIHKKLNVKIPAGVKNGSKIRIANEGNKGCNGGKNGDLFLKIEIEEPSFLKIDGLNTSCEIPITPYEAALGANIDVPTLKSHVSMKIPAGTTSGQKFRLSGEGLVQGGKKGDQIVTVRIEMPKEISKEEKELYEKLKKLSNHNIRENLKNG